MGAGGFFSCLCRNQESECWGGVRNNIEPRSMLFASSPKMEFGSLDLVNSCEIHPLPIPNRASSAKVSTDQLLSCVLLMGPKPEFNKNIREF